MSIFLFFTLLWLNSCYGVFFYQIFPSFEGLITPILFICDLGIIFLAFITLRKSSLKYFMLFLSICSVALISYVHASSITVGQFLNGARDFIPMFFSLIFINNMLLGSQKFIFYRKMNSFILLFLRVQVPVCILQFLLFGMGDYVGGTSGKFGSGNLSILIYMCTFYFLAQSLNPKRVLQSLLRNKYLFLLWIPSFINETKITFLLIPFFFLMCLNYKLRSMTRNILFAFIGICFLAIFLNAYQSFNNGRSILDVMQGGYIVEYDLEKSHQAIEKYGDKLGEHTDSRTLRLILGYWELQKDNLSLLFGKSLGHFKGGSIGLTKFAKENEYLTTGSKSFIIIVIMQVGIIGAIIVYLTIFISLSRQNELSFNLKNNEARIRCFLFAMLIGISYYSQAFRDFYFSAIFFYIGIVSTLPYSIAEQLKYQPFYMKSSKPSMPKNACLGAMQYAR